MRVKNYFTGEYFNSQLQFQPEEVTDAFWNILKRLSGEGNIPPRKDCIPRRRFEIQAKESETEKKQDDWEGMPMPLVQNDKPRRKITSLDY